MYVNLKDQMKHKLCIISIQCQLSNSINYQMVKYGKNFMRYSLT